MRAKTGEILADLEVDLDPRKKLSDLAIARKHLVAIARALCIQYRRVLEDLLSFLLETQKSKILPRANGR